MKLNRRLSCALMLLVMCVGLTAFGALLQVLNIVPDQAERTQTAEVQDLPTRIAMANATRHVELTATMLARPTATFTTSPTFTSTATPLPTNTPVPTETPPTAAFDEQAYISALTLALEVVASERNILSVQVADGRANGGEHIQPCWLSGDEDDPMNKKLDPGLRSKLRAKQAAGPAAAAAPKPRSRAKATTSALLRAIRGAMIRIGLSTASSINSCALFRKRSV